MADPNSKESEPSHSGHSGRFGGEIDLDFMRYFHLFVSRLWLIGIVAGVVVLIALGWLVQQPKIYASRAVLQVEQAEQKFVKVDDVQSEKLDTLDYLKTIESAMTNNTLLYRVVRTAGLDKDPNFAPKRDIPYTDGELALRFVGKVTVKLQRGTRLLILTVEDESPERARLLTELLIKEFLKQAYEQRLALSRTAGEFLTEESARLKKKLEASEMQLQKYKEEHNAVSLEDSQNIIIEKLKELNTKVTEAKSSRLGLESDLDQLKKLSPDQLDSVLQIGSVAAIPEVAQMRDNIFKAEAELASVQKRYLYKHPKYIEAQAQLDRYRQSLRDILRNAGDILQRQYQASESTEEKLNQALREQEKVALDLNKIAIPYSSLSREVESDRAMYQSVVTRQRETGITEAIEKTPFRIIEEPMVPSKPIKPRKTLTMAIALLLGLGLAGAIVIGMDLVDPSLRSVDQAEQFLNLACLAVIPEVRKTKKGEPNPLAENPVVLVSEPQSLQAEGFRTLRTGLSLLGDEADRSVFLVTSAVPSEGKSFSSINSSAAFAMEGFKTLLIDADLRRPTLQKLLMGPDKDLAGLTDVLSGNAKPAEAIHSTSVPNLFLLPAGRRAPNPAELLGGKQMAPLLVELRKEYDRIIIDSAPVNAVSDTLRLASMVQHIFMVIRSGKTPKHAIQRASGLIRKSGGKIAGFVLNRAVLHGSSGYYYYHYGDEYTKDSVYGTKA